MVLSVERLYIRISHPWGIATAPTKGYLCHPTVTRRLQKTARLARPGGRVCTGWVGGRVCTGWVGGRVCTGWVCRHVIAWR